MLWALENLQGLLKRYLKGWWKPNKLLPVDCLCFEHWTDNSSINMFRILLSFLHFNDKKKTTSGFFFLQNATQKLWNPSLNWFVPEIISKTFSSKILKKKKLHPSKYTYFKVNCLSLGLAFKHFTCSSHLNSVHFLRDRPVQWDKSLVRNFFE